MEPSNTSRRSQASKVDDELDKGATSSQIKVALESQENELRLLRQIYPLLAGTSQERLDSLNKAVLKQLDWRFLLSIIMMLLMR